MRTTKKILSTVLAVCMLASTSVISGFAATSDDAVSAGVDTPYSKACQALDDEYAYSGNDLGATYSPESTTFKVWSPTAESVALNLYATGTDSEPVAGKLGKYELAKVMDGEKFTGVWEVKVDGDLKNVYYTYTIKAVPTTGGAAITRETQDVYSVATGANGKRSMVCDLDSTDPEGWENDSHVLLNDQTDSSVWEIHVKDFSYDEASGVSEANRGKFLAFTEEGTTLNGEGNIATGIDYLKELGVTTVQITPFYDFQSINELGDDDQFNWGYDPQNYNVPEGSYSTNAKDGNVRIKECKQMIQALHNAGISVVMDVVYNHTYSTDSCFQYTVPNYYYRLDKDNKFSNGSGCGNECATERAMFRQFVIDSCRYWVDEYHIDGFRYDLMGLMDVETMNAIRANLDEVSPQITMWGEGWTGGTSVYPKTTCTGATFAQAIQTSAASLSPRVAFFNDGIRDGIKGSVFDINSKGFIQGNTDSEGKVVSAKGVICGLRGNVVSRNNWKASAPSQVVSYASCHDNATLYDQITAAANLGDYGVRNADGVKMTKLASAMLYTSQGATFSLAGEEMCRTKYGDTNSYKSPATLNMISWQNIVDYADVVSYYKGMIQIKSHFTPLTSNDSKYCNDTYYVMSNKYNEVTDKVSFTLANDQAGEWSKIAVLFNGSANTAEMTLADKSVTDWVIVANEESAGLEKLGENTGATFTVPARSAIIAVEKTSFESAALESGMGTVKVNCLYKDGTKLADSIVLKGTIGTAYEAPSELGVPDTYVLDKVVGETTGVYAEGTKEVNYYYTDFIPESILNADINGDGEVNIDDVSTMMKYMAEMITLPEDKIALLDTNCDGEFTIDDCTMLQKHLAEMSVSSGKVTINYLYEDVKTGELKNLTDPIVYSGKVGTPYEAKKYKVVGYAIDESRFPETATGVIPYGSKEVTIYYIPSSLDIKLHVAHDGNQTWAPCMWIWGSDLAGKDSANFTESGSWPGDTLSNPDSAGWYEYNFTYKGAGSYNVIVNNAGSPQSADYKGCVDNEMWVVIDDAASASTGSVVLKFYLDDPFTNPNAPIAENVYKAN